MKLPRRHIPILTRVLVVRRQLKERGVHIRRERRQSLSAYFEVIFGELKGLLNSSHLQLDHNPALGLRKLNRETGEYSPREHDHRFLEYRELPGHLHKTTGRKPGAEKTVTSKGSDIWLMKKFRRLEGKPKRRKAKIASRGFSDSRSKMPAASASGRWGRRGFPQK